MKASHAQALTDILTPRNSFVLVCVGLFACAIITYIFILRSCFFLNCVEDRSFNALDLDLPSDLFPVGAIVNAISRPSTSEGAFESAAKTVYWRAGNGIATYKVWRFRTEKEASQAFSAESGGMRYIENQSFFHHSSIADEFAVGCAQLQHFGYRCNMAARYQEYTINLIASIDNQMTMEMFNEVILFIDQEMEQRLYAQEEE